MSESEHRTPDTKTARKLRRQKAFLEYLKRDPNQGRACKATKISKSVITYWCAKSDRFKARLQEAMRVGAEKILDHAMDVATGQYKKLKFDAAGNAIRDPRDPKGKALYEEVVIDTALTIFMLKKLFPDQFGDEPGRLDDGRRVIVYEDTYNDAIRAAASAIAAAGGHPRLASTLEAHAVRPPLGQNDNGNGRSTEGS